MTVTTSQPYTRILKVQHGEEQSQGHTEDTLRTSKKKQLHHYIYTLRGQIQDGLKKVVPGAAGNQARRELDRPYSSYFEEILNLSPIQTTLVDMDEYADGCSVTFSVPFPILRPRNLYSSEVPWA